jgi:hypothetical protein
LSSWFDIFETVSSSESDGVFSGKTFCVSVGAAVIPYSDESPEGWSDTRFLSVFNVGNIWFGETSFEIGSEVDVEADAFVNSVKVYRFEDIGGLIQFSASNHGFSPVSSD